MLNYLIRMLWHKTAWSKPESAAGRLPCQACLGWVHVTELVGKEVLGALFCFGSSTVPILNLPVCKVWLSCPVLMLWSYFRIISCH